MFILILPFLCFFTESVNPTPVGVGRGPASCTRGGREMGSLDHGGVEFCAFGPHGLGWQVGQAELVRIAEEDGEFDLQIAVAYSEVMHPFRWS